MVVADVEQTLEFHRLAGYLYEVATAFSRFFKQCPVLKPGLTSATLGWSYAT